MPANVASGGLAVPPVRQAAMPTRSSHCSIRDYGAGNKLSAIIEANGVSLVRRHAPRPPREDGAPTVSWRMKAGISGQAACRDRIRGERKTSGMPLKEYNSFML